MTEHLPIRLSEKTAASTEPSGRGTAAISPAVTNSLRETKSKECTSPCARCIVNHAALRFTYIWDARMADDIRTHP